MNTGQPVSDRLSELPDSLIFNIFYFLPMTDVVRTTFLSKRYENLWTTVPFLNFEFNEKTNIHSIRKFIAWAVMLWRGNKILKLKIDFSTHLNKSLYDDIDLLVRFAKEFGVKELDIHLKYVYCTRNGYSVQGSDEKLYWAPRGLYSCSSIERLYLKHCNLQIHTMNNVSWNRLKCLWIAGYVVSQDFINKVLCGSPNLESLTLQFMENHENFSIESSSLRYVYIDKYLLYDNDDPSEVTELRISTPNLQELQILGVPYSKFSMNDAPLLTFANISFDDPNYYRHQLFSGYGFVGKTLEQILPTIQHVKELVLSDWCIEALGDVKNSNVVSSFPNVEVLKLSVHLKEYKKVAHLLEFFPQLKKLVIEEEKGCSQKYDGGESVVEFEADFSNSLLQKLWTIMITWGKAKGKKYDGGESVVEFEEDFPNSFLQKLRTISITWAKAKGENSIFPFIEIVLKYASKLKKMEFRSLNSLLLRSASEKVLRMPRSSPNADFIFCEEWF